MDISEEKIEQQCRRLALDIRGVTSYLLSAGIYSLDSIKHEIGIDEHALAQFLSRQIDRVRYSDTLRALYIFIVKKVRIADISDKVMYEAACKIKFSLDEKVPDSVRVFRPFIEFMDSSFNRIDRAASNFDGTFHVYRYSVFRSKNNDDDRVVKTRLRIFRDCVLEKMWKFEHTYVDQMGAVRISAGPIFVNIGSVYCIGKIGVGFGLDIIVFRDPSTPEPPQITQAIILTTDTRNQPVSCRAVIRRSSNTEENIGTFDYKKLVDDEPEVSGFQPLMMAPDEPTRATTYSRL